LTHGVTHDDILCTDLMYYVLRIIPYLEEVFFWRYIRTTFRAFIMDWSSARRYDRCWSSFCSSYSSVWEFKGLVSY